MEKRIVWTVTGMSKGHIVVREQFFTKREAVGFMSARAQPKAAIQRRGHDYSFEVRS